MTSIPCRMHCLTDSHERACAATRLPKRLASVTHIAISSSENGVYSAGSPVMYSPDRLILIWSTPHLTNCRTQRRTSSGPDTTAPKLNSCCGRGGHGCLHAAPLHRC